MESFEDRTNSIVIIESDGTLISLDVPNGENNLYYESFVEFAGSIYFIGEDIASNGDNNTIYKIPHPFQTVQTWVTGWPFRSLEVVNNSNLIAFCNNFQSDYIVYNTGYWNIFPDAANLIFPYLELPYFNASYFGYSYEYRTYSTDFGVYILSGGIGSLNLTFMDWEGNFATVINESFPYVPLLFPLPSGAMAIGGPLNNTQFANISLTIAAPCGDAIVQWPEICDDGIHSVFEKVPGWCNNDCTGYNASNRLSAAFSIILSIALVVLFIENH